MTAEIRLLTADDWAAFRTIRLLALQDAPEAFGATLASAHARTEEDWRALLGGRAQFMAAVDGADIGTAAGVATGIPGEAALISMWVAPQHAAPGYQTYWSNPLSAGPPDRSTGG